MRQWIVAAMVFLAGCTGSVGSGSEGEPTSAAGPGEGVLAGIVVDDAIRPIEGARVDVTAEGTALNATTGPDGQFRFEGLAPGAYIVRVAKAYYSPHEQAVVVETGVADPELVRFQLVFEASSIPFSTVYKYEGFHECGFNFLRVCSNINILTGIVLCGYDPPGAPCFNVTGDTSVFFQPIDGIPTLVQAELVWTPSTDFGSALNFYIGGGNISELQQGTASTYNFTSGESPLMVRITNHETEAAWCYEATECPIPDTLNQSRIGTERVLLGQVDAGPSIPSPLPPNPVCDSIAGDCSVGFSAQQPFTMFTTVFYGYEPPSGWRFASSGEVPPPPPPA